MSKGTRRSTPRLTFGAVLAVATLACGVACDQDDVRGTARTEGDIGGLPVTHFESGIKPNAPKPDLRVRNTAGTEDDELATATMADVRDYWKAQLPANFSGQQLEPLRELLSYDAESDAVDTECGSTEGLVNAFYCQRGDLIAWDRGVLLPMLRERFGPMAVVTVLAHEFGHAVQYQLGDKSGVDKSTKTIIKEQQADCLAGNYFRYAAAGDSAYFRVSTAEGINQALASLFFVRDEAGDSADEKGAHGTAFDRTYAFQLGFEQGPQQCAAIDQEDIDQRITEEAFDPKDIGEGDAQINARTLGVLQTSLDRAFAATGAQGPRLVVGTGRCPGGADTAPVSYCERDNTVNMDTNALIELGQSVDRRAETRGEHSTGLGDFAAFAEIASRYTQGVQKSVGASLDDANAGLRTSCLVGAWAGAADEGEGGKLRLSPGDLDEAIAELLRPRSVIAADVNGTQVPNGFARVESLRKGYLQGSQTCTDQYG